MKRVILAIIIPLCASAQIGELIQVRSGGVITPTNVVATLDAVAAAASAAAAAAVQAEIAEETATSVSNMLDDVNLIINGLEGVGYIQGFLLDFGTAGIEANTNVTSTIVKFVPAVSNDATYVYSDVYTYFTEQPAEFPVCRWTTSLGQTNEWDEATSVAVVLTDLLVSATYYQGVYRNTVRVPVASASSFFRVFAEAVQSQTGAFLPVRNGISPGGREPLTATFTAGTNVISFVGGIRVVPD